MVNLNTCKPGQRLVGKHGVILTYVRKLISGNTYPHEVKYPNGSYGTRTDDGFVFRNPSKRMEVDEDIVEILD